MLQNLYLSICKIIYGEFSEKYFFLVEDYKKRYPALNVTLKKCFKTDEILKFDGIIILKNSVPVYKTLQPIQMEEIKFGSDIKDIVGYKGKTTCANYVKLGEDTVQIIGYHERILNASARLNFFAIDGKYFFGEYHFSKYDKTRNIQIAKTIQKKYGIEKSNDEPNFYIEDEQGSILYFCDDGFSLSIKYFTPAYCNSYHQLQTLFNGKVAGDQTQTDELLKIKLESKL